MEESESIERIQELAQSFPSLSDHPAVLNWNPVALDRWAATVASTGERLASQFVLSVWNQYDKWSCGRFDVIDAMSGWDSTHWKAFEVWVNDPFTL